MEAITIKKVSWYNGYKFSLIPVLETKNGFRFRWLFFRAWYLEHISLSLEASISTHWGVGILGTLPYLRWVVCIPCPTKLEMWIDRKTTITPKKHIK